MAKKSLWQDLYCQELGRLFIILWYNIDMLKWCSWEHASPQKKNLQSELEFECQNVLGQFNWLNIRLLLESS